MKTTEWFDVSKNLPKIQGVYQTRKPLETEVKAGYQYWDGLHWGHWGYCVDYAFDKRFTKTSLAVKYWRGLAKDPIKTA